jgi:hypothetical protein
LRLDLPGELTTSMHRGDARTTMRTAWLVLIGAATFCCGCGQSVNPHPTARLAGRVTIDGRPIAQGRIQFFPITAGGQPDDTEIKDGEYAAEHVPRGKVRVVFLSAKETGKIIHDGHDYPEIASIIPDQYRSGIDIDVGEDNPNQVFALVSKATAASRKGG